MKKEFPHNFGLYGILTDPIKGYEYLTELFVDYEIAFIQLRMKTETKNAIYKTAEKLRRITDGSTSKFIINDHPQIAADIGADGVHVGQDDLSYDEVRSIVGEDMIIGLSTHNPDQATEACKHKPDYIGMGPVYPTPAKLKPDPVIGVDGLKSMLSVATVPAVAIGGIDLTNLKPVLQAGAKNFCMVRQLTKSLEPEKILKETLSMWRDFA